MPQQNKFDEEQQDLKKLNSMEMEELRLQNSQLVQENLELKVK